MINKPFGVFTHFIQRFHNIDDWNRAVNEFDVPALASSLEEVGAGWHFLTLMQGTKHLCAPNATFDRIAGTQPGDACSLRDLPADLLKAYQGKEIDLCLYFTADGPFRDAVVGPRMGYAEPRDVPVTEEFVGNWSAVLKEYALRYGERIPLWWIDGCYDRRHCFYTPETLRPYAEAVRAGNPNALYAFNNGVNDTLQVDYPNETMTAGEFNSFEFDFLPQSRLINGIQTHILAPIGMNENPYDRWCKPGTQHTKEHMAEFVRRANAVGCLVSIDVGIDPQGHIDPAQLELLKYVSDHV